MKHICLFLLLSSLAFGQGVILPTQQALKVVNGVMSPVSNATITVCASNASGIPCAPALVGAVFKDAALTQPLTNPFTSDANGNYVFAIAPGNYTVTISAAGFTGYSYQTTAPNASGASNIYTGNNTFTGSNTFSGSTTLSAGGSLSGGFLITAKSLNNIQFADQFAGADIFAKANAAATALGGAPGMVVIAPGSYSGVTSTLTCLNDVEFTLAGVSVAWSGTTGNAISAVSVERCKVRGPLHITGTKTAGTQGILLGNTTAGVAQTTNNVFEDIVIGDLPSGGASNGFGVGVKIDGNNNSGTYDNIFRNVASDGNLNQGWVFKPSLVTKAGAIVCILCVADHNGDDGFQIDGANLSTWTGIDTEANAGCGINIAPTATTTADTFYGGDSEGNTIADTCWGGHAGANAAGVVADTIIGINQGSTTATVGNVSAGSFNQYWPAGSTGFNFGFTGGTAWDWPVNASNVGNFTTPINMRNAENASSPIFKVVRTGAGTGTIALGGGGYPVTLGNITSGTGLQIFNTTTTCTTAATISTPCTTAAITLPVAYADTNYRIVCNGLPTVTAFPQIQTITKSNTTFTITVNNLTAAAASYGAFDCLVGHN